MLVLAMCSGLISFALAHISLAGFTVAHLRGIVDTIAVVSTLAWLPVAFHALFTIIFTKSGVRARFLRVKDTLKGRYFTLLSLVIATLALGWVITVVTEMVPDPLVRHILRIVLLLVVGVAMLFAMSRLYRRRHGIAPRSGSKTPKKLWSSTPDVQTSSVKMARCVVSSFVSPANPLTSSEFSVARVGDTWYRRSLSIVLIIVLLSASAPSILLYALTDTNRAFAAELEEPAEGENGGASEGSVANDDTPEDSTSGDEGAEASAGTMADSSTVATEAASQPEAATEVATEPPTKPLKSPVLEEETSPPAGAIAEIDHDRFTVTYLNADGTYTTRIQNEPLTYTDDNGIERDIDNTLIDTGDTFTNKDNAYSVTLPEAGEGISIANEGYTLTSTPLFAALKDAVVRDNAIYYNEAADGIDLEYRVTGSAVKENIILNHPVEFSGFEYRLEATGIAFLLIDNVVKGYRAGDVSVQPSGALDPKDGAEPVFSIAAPLMRDAADKTSMALALELEGSRDSVTLTILADAAWLDAPERAWPVIIDPSHALRGDNLTQGTIQAFAGYSSGPDMEHNISYLIVGFEDGSLVAVDNIVYGESWSHIKINDISPFIADLPERAILSASLIASKYGTVRGGSGAGLAIDAKMIAVPWGGDGRHTWNNRPLGAGLTYLDTQYTPAYKDWMSFDITEAFKAWKNDSSSNLGIMLCPQDESQDAVAFSGTGNQHGQEALYIDLSWTVPQPVDEDMALDEPQIKVRPLTYKHPIGLQNLTGVFADGIVRPALQVDYSLMEGPVASAVSIDSDSYEKAEYEPDYPNSDLFKDDIPFTLGFTELYESNWQTKLYTADSFELDTLYQFIARGIRVYDVWMNPDDVYEETPEGSSDTFLVYEFKAQDTLPYVANYYGVSRNQIALDNRVGDDLAMPGNTLFIRNPQTTDPYSRPDNLTLEHKRALIYANMGRSQVSEFDMEPVNMATGNFYMETTDATSSEYLIPFDLTRSYNSLSPQSATVFGRGWSSALNQVITLAEDGSVTYTAPDGRILALEVVDAGKWQGVAGTNITLVKVDAVEAKDVTYLLKDATETTTTFNAWGLPVLFTDRFGEVTSLAYDNEFRIQGITTPTGRHFAFTTSNTGQVTQITLPNGATLSYEYDADGYLVAFTDTSGARLTYTYDAAGQMTSWTDGLGNTQVENTYDSEGRVISQTDALGNVSTAVYSTNQTILTDGVGYQTVYSYNDLYQTTSIKREGVTRYKAYNAAGQLVSETDGAGRVTAYTYDAAGNLTTVTRADGSYRETSYDGRRLPVSVRDFDGSVIIDTYDAQGFLIGRTNADGTTLFYTNDAHGRMASLADENGNTTTFSYNGTASLTVTDATGNATVCYYDAMGNLINEMDAEGIEHKTSYTPGGKLAGTWLTGGIVTSYSYDAGGNCIAITDANGNTSSYAYDAAYRLISATAPDGSSQSYVYDALGNKTSITDPRGNTTTFSYDAFGNCISETDALGNTAIKSYDGAGRLSSSTDAAAAVTAYAYAGITDGPTSVTSPKGTDEADYDALGRVVAERHADGTSLVLAYDARGHLISKTDQAGLETIYSYDGAGNMVGTSDSAGVAASYTYDAAGHLTSETDALGRVTSYTYDRAGRLVEAVAPGGLVAHYTSDSAGNITVLVRPDGSTIHMAYDGLGNLISMTDAAGNTTEYSYGPTSNLKTITDAKGGVTRYTYTPSQLLSSKAGPSGETISYTYDKVNRPVAVTDERGGISTLEYDAVGNNTKVTDASGSYAESTYDEAGRLTESVDTVGLIKEYGYDARGNLIRLADNAGADAGYVYDSSGRLVAETDALGRISTTAYDLHSNVVSETDFNGDTTEYRYDALDRIIAKTTSADGRTIVYAYDEAGNLLSETDDLGRMTSYTYDLLGQPISRTDSMGNTWVYAYDAAGNLVSETDPADSVTAYAYDALGNLASMTDALGNTTSYVYDASSRPIKKMLPNGAELTYAYDVASNLVALTDELGNTTSYTYDAIGRQLSVTTAQGAVTSYAYDAHSNIISTTDPLGYSTVSEYSLSGLLLTRVHPSGLEDSYAYDAIGRILSISDNADASVEFSYDSADNVASQKNQDGALTRFAYDSRHLMTSSTDALGAVTKNTYDSAGNLISSVLPTGNTMSYTYDLLDRPITGANSVVLPTEFIYDNVGNLIKTVQGEKTNSSNYDAAGKLLKTTDPLDNVTRYVYNEMGLPIKTTDRTGASTSYTYDAKGQMTALTDKLGNTTSRTLDAHGNALVVTDSLGNTTKMAYDDADNLVGLIDPLGREMHYTYDGMGNRTSVRYGADDALYAATALGQVLALDYLAATGANEYRYTYDLHSNLVSIESPDGTVERFVYDAAGRVREKTQPSGAKIAYDYDLLGNLVKKDYQGKLETTAYAYDSAGNRLAMADESGESTYGYDKAGRLISHTQADGRSLTYTYDDYGRMARVTYPDGRSVSYTYDLADNITTVDDTRSGTTAYTYDGEGRPLTCVRPDGTSTTYTYDAAGNVIKLLNRVGSALLSSFAYTYDALGRIATEVAFQEATDTDEKPVSYTRSYTYDAAGELAGYTEVSDGASSTTTYAYNLRGMRVASTSTADGITLSATYDAEGRIISQRDDSTGITTTYSYDDNGNLIQKNEDTYSNTVLSTFGVATDTTVTTYAYDAENRLRAVREGGALLMAATYDGDDNRIFQVHRTVVPTGESKPVVLTANSLEALASALSPISLISVQGGTDRYGNLTPDSYHYIERIPAHDFKDYSFAYGFGSSLLASALGLDMAFVPFAFDSYNNAWMKFLATYGIELRYDETGGYSTDDLAALEGAGLTEADLYALTYPAAAQMPSLAQPDTSAPKQSPEQEGASSGGAARDPSGERDPVIIPTGTDGNLRYDYELTYYVNDITYEHAQVAAEYGRRGESKGEYTYGTERIAKTGADGSLISYLYDGRGSVAQAYLTEDAWQSPSSVFPNYDIYSGGSLATLGAGSAQTSVLSGGKPTGTLVQNYSYDPFGALTSDIDPNNLAFAYNAEEYNPVTALHYLRARYYSSGTASFITQDTELGHVGSLNSQSRYLFAESDPINNTDPSGHAIGNSSYEKAMEAAGGINEIYNFYVGQTLTNAYSRASASFYSKLAYAYGVDYTSQAAINSIAGISQAEANWFINQGAAAAAAAGRTWGCSPGSLVNTAVNLYAADVNSKKNSVNSQISAVKSNKQVQYNQYQAYLAWIAEQQRQLELLAAKFRAYGSSYAGYLRIKYNISTPYSNEYILQNYGSSANAGEYRKIFEPISPSDTNNANDENLSYLDSVGKNFSDAAPILLGAASAAVVDGPLPFGDAMAIAAIVLISAGILVYSAVQPATTTNTRQREEEVQYWQASLVLGQLVPGKPLTYSEAVAWVANASGTNPTSGNTLFGNGIVAADQGAAYAVARNYPGFIGPELHGGGADGYLWHYHQNASRSNGDVHIWFYGAPML
jgi:RHS repeat-associated protein